MNMRPTRLWYFTDLHGSALCYAKILAVAAQAVEKNLFDAIIVGGDLCGSELAPIIRKDGNWFVQLANGQEKIGNNEEYSRFSNVLTLTGQYPYECQDEDELLRLEDEEYRQAILDQLAEARVSGWMSQADVILPSGYADRCKLILNTGTSDPPKVDQILSNHPSVIFSEDSVHELPGNLWVASTSYREWLTDSEPHSQVGRRRKTAPGAMRDKIRRLIEPVPDLDRCIFNFHVPPYNTIIDQFAHRPHFPVPDQHSGSKIIQKAIDFHQPLASLHGYAHEARAVAKVGKTLCFNPGTEFYRGHLSGVIIEVDDKGQITYRLTEDPLFEASDALEEEFFWHVAKTVFKHTVPFFGAAIKIWDEIKIEIHNQPKK